VIVSRAPLRISLGGGGTDLPSYYENHGGFILSAAINKYVYVYVNRPAADDLIRVKYSRYEQVESVSEIEHDLVRPALELLNIDRAIEISSMADVPAGTGLGSSGSYLVAMLSSLHELNQDRQNHKFLAEQACHIEMDLAGHSVGKHDHYLAAFGGITTLEIDKSGDVVVSPLSISASATKELQDSLLLFFTGISRSSRQILQQQKNDTEVLENEVIDSLHVTKELGYRVKASLEQGDINNFGLLLEEHWQNKKRRSGNISNSAIDSWYDVAKNAGATGGKIIGAGGGGFLMLHCQPDVKKSVRMAMNSEGLREMPFEFDYEGAQMFAKI